jgi:hypothetical protein
LALFDLCTFFPSFNSILEVILLEFPSGLLRALSHCDVGQFVAALNEIRSTLRFKNSR